MPTKKPDDPRYMEPGMDQDEKGIFRKILKTGKGVINSTEGGLRNMVGEITLPGEIVSYMTKSIDRAKNEIVRMISDEVRQFLNHLNLTEEMVKAMSNLSVEVSAQIKFKNDGDPGLTVGDVSLKPTRNEAEQTDIERNDVERDEE